MVASYSGCAPSRTLWISWLVGRSFYETSTSSASSALDTRTASIRLCVLHCHPDLVFGVSVVHPSSLVCLVVRSSLLSHPFKHFDVYTF
ncbi:hypothetical protein SprV_0200770400 [Sparganum proliferum]